MEILKITVERKYYKENYTIGNMFIDGVWFCNTLEDKDRGLNQSLSLSQNKKLKVYSQTAIPKGIYNVTVVYWAKHRINVPFLHDVPAFTGILIHNGVNQNYTEGCILVGLNTIKGQLTSGKKYMVELTNIIQEAIKNGKKVMIEVK